jgi:hypothetical protein
MKNSRISAWLAPTTLALLSLIAGFYLLLGPTPKNNLAETEINALDTDLLEYFTAQAEKYAKEESGRPGAVSLKN